MLSKIVELFYVQDLPIDKSDTITTSWVFMCIHHSQESGEAYEQGSSGDPPIHL